MSWRYFLNKEDGLLIKHKKECIRYNREYYILYSYNEFKDNFNIWGFKGKSGIITNTGVTRVHTYNLCARTNVLCGLAKEITGNHIEEVRKYINTRRMAKELMQ